MNVFRSEVSRVQAPVPCGHQELLEDLVRGSAWRPRQCQTPHTSRQWHLGLSPDTAFEGILSLISPVTAFSTLAISPRSGPSRCESKGGQVDPCPKEKTWGLITALLPSSGSSSSGPSAAGSAEGRPLRTKWAPEEPRASPAATCSPKTL